MSIRSGLKAPIALPFTVAALKLTVPKFVRGSTPPELEGASAIASADASVARFERWTVVKLCPVVLFLIVRVKLPFPFVVTEPLIESPGRIARLRFVGNFGYISYHA